MQSFASQLPSKRARQGVHDAYDAHNAHNTPDTPRDHADSANLRRAHLHLLSTVLHRCLHDRDYPRAARAWGMILRTHATHGHTVDLRNHARWGIGAEILLRRPHHDHDHDADHGHDANHGHINAFSEQGFELAREYYERLIVQYPARKQAPHAVDQRSFYPAMFSLWIQQVVEKSAHLRSQANASTHDPTNDTTNDTTHDITHDTTHDPPSEDAIQAQELAAAMEIADRLDDLVASPPFDKHPSLLLLRANTALWISDLIVGNTPATPFDEWDPYPINDAPDQLPKFTNCLRELRTAQTYLQRVDDMDENRLPQRRQLQRVEARLRELQSQMELCTTRIIPE